MNRIHDVHKLIKLTGGRAKLDAKAYDTYIVYKNITGQIVKEYTNGKIIPIDESESSYE